ncbi:solute carrier family 13 member 1-like, partial [Centroberyx affinis]|uniref:solute carrier family 13 member 1-like n=1 Tax=Centroberyx affinis TaxID=166261 RepID=UPI003A5BE285
MSRRFCRGGLWENRGVVLVVLTPLLLLPLPVICRTKVADCAFVLLLMAVFWVTEVIPLPVTAMIPAVLFPLLGIMESAEVARVYFKDFHFLLVGVICLSSSIEKWGLHRRIALRLVTLVGLDPAWLMLGFMSGCAFLSMWVHNTSAVTMVMPIVEAVIQQVLKAGGAGGASGEENPALQLDGNGNALQSVPSALSTAVLATALTGRIDPPDPAEKPVRRAPGDRSASRPPAKSRTDHREQIGAKLAGNMHPGV